MGASRQGPEPACDNSSSKPAGGHDVPGGEAGRREGDPGRGGLPSTGRTPRAGRTGLPRPHGGEAGSL
eukprot:1182572-Prorocentrum_minimum.AAC.9